MKVSHRQKAGRKMLGFIICSSFSLEARLQTGHPLPTEVVGSRARLGVMVGMTSLRPPDGDDKAYCVTLSLGKQTDFM